MTIPSYFVRIVFFHTHFETVQFKLGAGVILCRSLKGSCRWSKLSLYLICLGPYTDSIAKKRSNTERSPYNP